MGSNFEEGFFWMVDHPGPRRYPRLQDHGLVHDVQAVYYVVPCSAVSTPSTCISLSHVQSLSNQCQTGYKDRLHWNWHADSFLGQFLPSIDFRRPTVVLNPEDEAGSLPAAARMRRHSCAAWGPAGEGPGTSPSAQRSNGAPERQHDGTGIP